MTYRGHGYGVVDCDASSDSGRMASCGGDRQVFYWDVAAGTYIRKFRGHESGAVNCVRFCGSGPTGSATNGESVIASGGYDKLVHFWDCRSNSTEPIQTIDCFRDSVSSITLGQSGAPRKVTGLVAEGASDLESDVIVAASVDGTIRSIDIRKGSCLIDDIGMPVTCVSLSNDGYLMLASCVVRSPHVSRAVVLYATSAALVFPRKRLVRALSVCLERKHRQPRMASHFSSHAHYRRFLIRAARSRF